MRWKRGIMIWKKILVPLDGSKNSFRGLDTAIYLARQGGATLTGIFVLPRIPSKVFRKLQNPEKAALKMADRIMERAKTRAAQNGIVFNKKIDFGDPGAAIVKFAKSLNYDIIVIGARGQSGIKDIFLGSVSNYVLHRSTAPVVIVK
jgi:nucleotide-binding universal stress UspA family protein